MPARRKTEGRKAVGPRVRAMRSKVTRSTRMTVTRIQRELPETLADFSKHVGQKLTGLEKRVEKAAAPARREIAKTLREVSHALGRYEAEGERRWKALTGNARREALSILHRLEKMIESPRRKKAPARKRTARRKTTAVRAPSR